MTTIKISSKSLDQATPCSAINFSKFDRKISGIAKITTIRLIFRIRFKGNNHIMMKRLKNTGKINHQAHDSLKEQISSTAKIH